MRERYSILLAGEPNESIAPYNDTGMLWVHELVSRGHGVDFCDLTKVNYRINSEDYLSNLPVRTIESVRLGKLNPFQLLPLRMVEASSFDGILQRKEPPVDEIYLGHAKHFSLLPASVIQINQPEYCIRWSEHLIPRRYPNFGVTTVECTSLESFIDTIRKLNAETVAKPLHLFGGTGIEFFHENTSEVLLQNFWKQWGPRVAVQPFLPEIETIGDLRVLTMNGKIVGSYLRRPKKGSRLANTHQGATSHAWELTPTQNRAVDFVMQDLMKYGLYLLGIDFIGDKISEVNITCPSGLHQINAVMNIRGENLLASEFESLIKNCETLLNKSQVNEL